MVNTVELVDEIHAQLEDFLFRTGREPSTLLLAPEELYALQQDAPHLVLHLPTCYKVMGHPVLLLQQTSDFKVALILET